MDRKDIFALAVKYQGKAAHAFMQYRETGELRYYRTYTANDDLANALQIAADASDDHDRLVQLRGSISMYAVKAKRLLEKKDQAYYSSDAATFVETNEVIVRQQLEWEDEVIHDFLEDLVKYAAREGFISLARWRNHHDADQG